MFASHFLHKVQENGHLLQQVSKITGKFTVVVFEI